MTAEPSEKLKHPPGFPPPVSLKLLRSVARIERMTCTERDDVKTFIRKEFAMGKDTVGMARSLGVPEWYADMLFHEAMKDRGRINFDTGNACGYRLIARQVMRATLIAAGATEAEG